MKSLKFIFIYLFFLSSFGLESMSDNSGIYADKTITSSQEDIRSLENFLREVVDPKLSITDKIKKYDAGFDQYIKKDTAGTDMDKFLINFVGFVTNVSTSAEATIDNLNAILDLYAKVRDGGKLSPSQQAKLSIGLADSLKRKLTLQKDFKSKLEGAAKDPDFVSKFGRYRVLLTKDLTDNINLENRRLFIDGFGLLASAVLSRSQKDIMAIRSFLNDILKDKFYVDKNKLLAEPLKEQIQEYIKTLDSKLSGSKETQPSISLVKKPAEKQLKN